MDEIIEPLDLRTIDYSIAQAAGLIDAPTFSGVNVTETTAIGLPALWCGCKVICEDIACLPLELLVEDKDGHSTKAKTQPLFRTLGSAPNNEMSKTSFWETMILSAIIYGNGIAEMVRSNDGEITGFYPVHPHYVRIYRNPDDGGLRYHDTRNAYGGPTGSPGSMKDVPAEDVIHFHGLSIQGGVGLSLLSVARQTLGWGIGAQRFGSSLWRNVAKPKGIITETTPLKTSSNAEENLKKSWQKDHSHEEVGNTAFLRYGYKYDALSMDSNEQIQYTQLLSFYNSEVARILRLNPTKLMDMGRATWGNLTEVNRDHWGTSLQPWAVKIEEELEKKCLEPNQLGKYKIRFNTDKLLRADKETRYTTYSTALAGQAFLTPNDVRQMEDLPPMPEAETDTSNVQDTALNGIQITSLLSITDKLANKEYPPDAVKAILQKLRSLR